MAIAVAFFQLTNMENKRYPLPPFTMETALQKVQAAEDAWNTKDPEKVSLPLLAQASRLCLLHQTT